MTPATRARIDEIKLSMHKNIWLIPRNEQIYGLISELEKCDRALEAAKVDLRNISENGFGFISGCCASSLKKIAQIMEGGSG